MGDGPDVGVGVILGSAVGVDDGRGVDVGRGVSLGCNAWSVSLKDSAVIAADSV